MSLFATDFVVRRGAGGIANDFPANAHLSRRMWIGVAKHNDVFRIERYNRVLAIEPKTSPTVLGNRDRRSTKPLQLKHEFTAALIPSSIGHKSCNVSRWLIARCMRKAAPPGKKRKKNPALERALHQRKCHPERPCRTCRAARAKG